MDLLAVQAPGGKQDDMEHLLLAHSRSITFASEGPEKSGERQLVRGA